MLTINSIVAKCDNLTIDSGIYVYRCHATYNELVDPDMKGTIFVIPAEVKEEPVKTFYIDHETWSLHVYL